MLKKGTVEENMEEEAQLFVLVTVSVAVKRHRDHDNSYTGKLSIGAAYNPEV